MRNLRWDRIGLTLLNALLVILAVIQSNWLAAVAFIIVIGQTQVLYALIRMNAHLYNVMGIASEFIKSIAEETDNGDTKN